MFDTHCHLNFSRFKKNVNEVISRSQQVGVTHFVVPGTDPESSQKAVDLAEKYNGIYAAVGIHPHHAFQYQISKIKYQNDILNIKNLLKRAKVVAIGEIGLDKHIYKETKYEEYNVTDEFFRTQKELLLDQLKLAVTHQKSVILHNREASEELLEALNTNWDKHFEGRTVFHCCEPNKKLLQFAKEHNVFIGVDGDITYEKEKQDFIREVPLEMLVVETDSPFLLPEPLRSRKEFPNEPKNIPFIISFVANLTMKSKDYIAKVTEENGKRLYHIT